MKPTLGQIGYEAYGDAAAWKTFDDRDMPTWENVALETRRRWEVAALAICQRSPFVKPDAAPDAELVGERGAQPS